MSQEIVVQQRAIITMFEDPDRLHRLAASISGNAKADFFAAAVITAVMKSEKLSQCTSKSIWDCAIDCAKLGLVPNGRDAHLVPFRVKGVMTCTLIPDYKGLIQLAYQSGLVDSIHAHCVREGDYFEYSLGSKPYVEFKKSQERGVPTHAFAIVNLRGSSHPIITVLTAAEVLKHRACSKSARYDDSPWVKHEDEMWAKTAIKVACKFMPQIPTVQAALDYDNQHDGIYGNGGPSRSTSFVETEDAPETIDQEATGNPDGLAEDKPDFQ